MRLITKFEFTEKEKEALKGVAKISCIDIDCLHCPFYIDIDDVETGNCLKTHLRAVLDKEGISWQE